MKQIANFGGSTTSGDATKETLSKVKTSRESVTSSSTLQDDNDFTFSVKANTTYAISGNLFVSAGSGGFKWLFTVPSGASGRLNVDSGTDTLSGINGIDVNITVGQSVSSAISISTPAQSGKIGGFITTSSTAGTVTFRWAQNTSNATATYIERGSTMILTEV
jgi:hypothetical protein